MKKSRNSLNLEERLRRIDTVFGEQLISDRDTADTANISRYYRKNRWAYALLNSREGFVHMGLSTDGSFKPEDMYGQAKFVADEIRKTNAKQVIELATGKGASLIYLARQFPERTFKGLDLPNGQLEPKESWPKNVSIQFGDYHDLSCYADGSADIIYIVEALCHARSKQQVLKEAFRVLRPGGKCIIFDGYSSKNPSQMAPVEKRAFDLTYKSMMVESHESAYKTLLDFSKNVGFDIESEKNLKKEVMPSMRRLERIAHKVFRTPRLSHYIARLIGLDVTGNAIAGYLMAPLLEENFFLYMRTVLKKPQ